MSTDEEPSPETTRITRKGQTTIPKSLREEYDLEEGDELIWERSDDGITVRKVTKSAGRGMLVDDDVSSEKRKEMAEEMDEMVKELRRSKWSPE
jgi:AbrB family looped-hinge helix DNA binding protein